MRSFMGMSLVVAFAGLSAAQTAGAMTDAPALVQGQQGEIAFVSGGTSLDDRAALRQTEDQYNLRLTFAVRPSGEYLSDVNVTLTDDKGQTLLDTISNGPLFFAHVPPGRYRVTVTSGRETQTRDIAIGATGPASQAFYWRQAA